MARKMSRFDHVSAVERKKVPRAAACPFAGGSVIIDCPVLNTRRVNTPFCLPKIREGVFRDTPQKCRFTLGFCMLNFSIVGCPKDTPAKMSFYSGILYSKFFDYWVSQPEGGYARQKWCICPEGFQTGLVACVTSQKVVQADSTSGRYNLSSVISYSKGFEIVTSLIRPLVI